MAVKVAPIETSPGLAALLSELERGGDIVITRSGRPVARLIRAQGYEPRLGVGETVSALRRLVSERGIRLDAGEIRSLVDEGRD
ncbi:MAG: hypothetical protein JO048_05765 [Methylobacteriaceae bacterium]|nr:hypothetical protein [Methylobacteriaceae bacterium]